MQSPIKPPTRTLLIFARPESQQDDERQEGIIETSDGPQYFTVGDFLMRFVEWRTNRANALQDYLDELAEYQEQQADDTDDPGAKEPDFREWDVPTLRKNCIQANCNVIKLEPSTESTFDYWLKVSTLDKGNPLLIPVKLADYHKCALRDPKTGSRRKINSSVQLNK